MPVPLFVNSTRPTCGGDRNVGRVEFTDSAPGKPAREHAWLGWGEAPLVGCSAQAVKETVSLRQRRPKSGSGPLSVIELALSSRGEQDAFAEQVELGAAIHLSWTAW